MEHLDTLLHVNSPLPLVPALLLAAFAWLVTLLISYRDGRAFGTSKGRDDIETVPGYPLLGNLLQVHKQRDQLIELWIKARLNRQHPEKHLSFTVPGRRIIDCSKPEYLEYIQRTAFSNYVKGPIFYSNTKEILGDGIFAVDGEKWHSQRKATSKIFNANNFRGIITTSIDSNLEKLLGIVRRHADSGEDFSLDELFFKFTLNSFAEMAFGCDVGALSLDTDEVVPFAVAFDFAQSVLDRRFNDPFWKITEMLNGQGKAMKDAGKVLDDFAYSIIEQRETEGRGNFTAEKKQEAKNLDLLSLYMALRDENGQPMSKKALRDSVLNLIIAGRDTTAQALSWTFYRLLLNPELIGPVRAEVDEIGAIDYDSYRTLVQVNAAFMEGLRLHPSVPKNGWQALADDVIPGGPTIKKGDLVFWSDWMMARDETIWGEDAKEFKPSRWVNDEGELVKETQWKAHMFNGGYRLCLGMDLAKYEAAAVMAAITSEFDLSFAPGWLDSVPMMETENTPKYHPSLTLPMHTPLRVVAQRRKKA